jgi:hypothetical protein
MVIIDVFENVLFEAVRCVKLTRINEQEGGHHKVCCTHDNVIFTMLI